MQLIPLSKVNNLHTYMHILQLFDALLQTEFYYKLYYKPSYTNFTFRYWPNCLLYIYKAQF